MAMGRDEQAADEEEEGGGEGGCFQEEVWKTCDGLGEHLMTIRAPCSREAGQPSWMAPLPHVTARTDNHSTDLPGATKTVEGEGGEGGRDEEGKARRGGEKRRAAEGDEDQGERDEGLGEGKGGGREGAREGMGDAEGAQEQPRKCEENGSGAGGGTTSCGPGCPQVMHPQPPRFPPLPPTISPSRVSGGAGRHCVVYSERGRRGWEER